MSAEEISTRTHISAVEPPKTELLPETTMDTMETMSLDISSQNIDANQPLEVSDIEAMHEKHRELKDVSEVQRGLEIGILGSGFQVMADRFGAERLLDAMKTEPAFHEVVDKLAPNKKDKKELFDAIKAEPIVELAERINETVGGVTDGNSTVDQIEQYRQFSAQAIEDGKAIEGGDMLYAGNLERLLEEHPELSERFIETNDTLLFLKGIRDIYNVKDAEFAPELEKVKARVESEIKKDESSIAELQDLSDAIHADEIKALEARLESAGSDDATAMINALLEKKVAEVTESRSELAARREKVESQVLNRIGATRLQYLKANGPIRTTPIRTDKYTSMPIMQN